MNTETLIHNTRRTVLVVEDEAINREMLGFILQEQYDVLYAENGREALDLLRSTVRQVSMVLLDINMPVMNGFEMMREMREDAALSLIPVIVLTSDRNAELAALDHGAVDFIPKPYDMPSIILARVARIIQFTEDRRIIRDVEHDELTGLYTRSFFHEYCAALIRDHGVPLDMIAVDVDRFRLVNEVKGKAFGDKVLCAMADGIRALLQEHFGISCRSDGDVFFILVEHLPDYEEVTRSILDSAARLEGLPTLHLRVGVYPGVDQSHPADWFSDAAKSAAGSMRGNYARSVTLYDTALNEKELYDQRLVSDMDEALKTRQFKVFFQPKYRIQGEAPQLCSAEALVRWVHPELGFISPGAFIPLFEENGLITRLDEYVWEAAAAQVSAWRDQYGCILPVSVNLSRQDLFEPELLEILRGILAKYGLTTEALLLEVTESAYAQDVDYMLAVVGQLRDAGFRIEMDDFGSGYSSLNMLCLMPIDILKIDMKFVQNLMTTADGYHVLELVVNLSHTLHLPALVEGVEDQAQYDLVRKAGCDIVQGYYFSRPVEAAAFEQLIREAQEKGTLGV